MRRAFGKVLLGTVAAAALLTGASSAQAAGFGLHEQSAVGLGAAFAGAAAGGAGLDSMYWNPATMTQYQGWQSSWSVTGIFPDSRMTAYAPTPTLGLGAASGNIGQGAVLPASYTSIQINQNTWVGLAINAPFGLTTKSGPQWAGQTYGRTSAILSQNLNPNVAYKVNDWLSVAAGLQVEYFRVRLTQALAAAPNAPSGILTGDSIGLGFKLGATITPMDGTEIGIGYRSRVRQDLSGKFASPLGVTHITTGLWLPDSLTVGVRQRISPAFTLLGGFEWTNWSLLKSAPVLAGSIPITTIQFQWRDGFMYSLGGEYKATQDLTLRAGVAYEVSPVTTHNRGTRLPDTNRIWATAGLTYQVTPNLDLSASYAHIFTKRADILITAASGNPQFNGLPFFGDAKSHIDIVSVGLKYRWDHAPVAVVAKY